MAKIYKCVVNNYKIKLFCNKRDAEDDAVILSNFYSAIFSIEYQEGFGYYIQSSENKSFDADGLIHGLDLKNYFKSSSL